MDDLDSDWRRKGATLSDKTARQEFGLTQDELVQAIRAGNLHYREASMHGNPMHGNPWLRLLRREVEALVKKKHGDHYLKTQQAKTELGAINRELRSLRSTARFGFGVADRYVTGRPLIAESPTAPWRGGEAPGWVFRVASLGARSESSRRPCGVKQGLRRSSLTRKPAIGRDDHQLACDPDHRQARRSVWLRVARAESRRSLAGCSARFGTSSP